jgi:hypothetical protein
MFLFPSALFFPNLFLPIPSRITFSLEFHVQCGIDHKISHFTGESLKLDRRKYFKKAGEARGHSKEDKYKTLLLSFRRSYNKGL